jgi:alanine racemase
MNRSIKKQKSLYNSYLLQNNPKLLQNWIELSASAVEHNAQQFKQWLGQKTKIAAVIKSNAYGHGIIEMAKLYEACNNIDTLCVINLSEAIEIRQSSIKKPILVIGYLDTDYDFIAAFDIQVALYDLEIAFQLNLIGKKYNKFINVHIKFDTGMSRLGIINYNLKDFIQNIAQLDWIKIKGIFSHLAESYNKNTTDNQEAVFSMVETLYTDKILPQDCITHISNSHGSITTRHEKYNLARIGIGLYGYLQKHSQNMQNLLVPVLSLKTKILQIKEISKGTFIGYDGIFQAPCNMTIAILAIGYHEGLDSRLSNSGFVIVNGLFAPIIGRICMNLTTIDISNIPNCKKGQIVTILGKEGSSTISVYDWSIITKASVYNLLTKISYKMVKIIIQ